MFDCWAGAVILGALGTPVYWCVDCGEDTVVNVEGIIDCDAIVFNCGVTYSNVILFTVTRAWSQVLLPLQIGCTIQAFKSID